MQIQAHGISDKGQLRTLNEDSLLLDSAHQFYAVADGLGGLPGGQEASSRITNLLQQHLQNHPTDTPVKLKETIHQVHKTVTAEGLKAHPFTGYGSTLTLGQLFDNTLHIAHIGDSGAYLLRNDKLTKVTIDHTMEQEYLKTQGNSARPNMPPEYAHTLTRCLGQEGEIEIDFHSIQTHSKDRILLCSDGLNRVLTAEEIQDLLQTSNQPSEICQLLVRMANEKGGPDNITVIVIIIA